MSIPRGDITNKLRSMAREGNQPSAMLREIISRLAPESADQQLLVRYFGEAFSFTEGQAYTIFGWLPDGKGKLPDATLDYLLSRRILETRGHWDRADEGTNGIATVELTPESIYVSGPIHK